MKLNLFKIIRVALITLIVGAILQPTTGINALAFTGGVMLLGVVYNIFTTEGRTNLAMMALFLESWKDTIEEELFKDNSFVTKSQSAEDFVLNGKVVHIPQSGGSTDVIKNPDSFPMEVNVRADSDEIYVIDHYVTKPVLVPYVENMEYSYDKRVSVMGENLSKLLQDCAEGVLYNWLVHPTFGAYSGGSIPVATNAFPTTGANGTSNAEAVGATGNRKKAQLADLQTLQTYFRSINYWREGKMHIMLPPQMLAELFPADSQITATYMRNVTDEEFRMGIMFKAYGFIIWSRSSVVNMAAGGASVKAPGATGAADDAAAALAWCEDAVEYANGQTWFSFKEKAPEYANGDIYNMGKRVGGRARRSDYKGVALLYQAATS